MNAIEVNGLSKSFRVKLKEKGFKGSLKAIINPKGIFKGAVKFILYILIPVGMTNYLPVHIMTKFNPLFMLAVIGYMVMLVVVAVLVFYRGLRRYSSSSLMVARM